MLRTRLVVTSADVTAGSEAGRVIAWEAELADGWKTYWRSPGEAGLPVRMSRNGEAVDLLYPLPDRFELFGLETYGYSKKVLIPFTVDTPTAGGANLPLTIDGSFMVCKDICVPFNASYTLNPGDFAADFSGHDIRVEAWLKRTPDREGDGGAGLTVTSARVTGAEGHQRLVVEARADTRLDKADMLAEVNDMFQFGKPEMKLRADGKSAVFVLPVMTGKKTLDLRGERVRLTFSDGRGHAVESFVETGR
jgi:suppressor for copper-sensitivity B